MLEKMGWKKGEGLGKDGAGMKDPVIMKMCLFDPLFWFLTTTDDV